MSNTYKDLQNSHPCFGGHRNNVGRIHLPVNPGCNIACRFCDRVISDVENRPGVTSKVLAPEESIEVLEKALKLCPEITVAGIAGPGDTLATDYALQTFRLIKEKFPDLIKCMSTNGLLLYEKADEVIDVGIDSLTVTVNAVDPQIEAKLNKYIVYHGKRYEGVEAAEILIENQIKGIKKVASAGITVKVNTVLVPGINDDHIETVAQTVKEAGASIYNIIPLIEKTIEAFLGERAVNFFCYAISEQNDCLLCSAFFRKILRELDIDFDTFAFTEKENLLIQYGKAIVSDANNIPKELFDELKKYWNEEQIVAITAFATIMIATNIINKSLDVDLGDNLIPYTKK